LMRFAWLFLMPLTLVNIIVTGALLLIPVGLTGQLIIAGAVNWLLMIFIVLSFRRLTGVSATGKIPRWLKAKPVNPKPTAKPATKSAPALATTVVDSRK